MNRPIIATPAAMRREPPLTPPDPVPQCRHDFPRIPIRTMRLRDRTFHLWRCRRCGHEIDDI